MADQPTHEERISGPATIEIAGFHRVFRTRNVAWPDMLFVPLVEQVRAALAVADALAQADPAKLEDSVLIAERYLSGCLLQDSNLLICVGGQSEGNFYKVDVKAGILQFRTMMYAGQGKRTSCFKIQANGNVRDGKFSVESPADGPVIVTFGEESMKQPDFFSKILAPLCLVSLIQREQAAHPENSGALLERIQITLSVKLCESAVSLLIRKDGTSAPWQVFELVKGEEIGVIPDDAIQDIDLLLDHLASLVKQALPPAPAIIVIPTSQQRSHLESSRTRVQISASAKH
jgi:hypothetical protein